MSYVPPHKRQSNTHNGPPPTPELLVPEFKKGLNLRSSRTNFDKKAGKNIPLTKAILYADNSISRWLAVPLTDDRLLPPSVGLMSVFLEPHEWRKGDKPLTLVNAHCTEEKTEGEKNHLSRPWAMVAETIHSDLLVSFENLRKELVEQTVEETKPTLVARFGKLLFHRTSSLSLDSLSKLTAPEACTRDLRRVFYTNVTNSYMEYVKSGIIPKLGICKMEQKERYNVKLADSAHPSSIVSCKCKVKEGDNKLELYKVEFKPLRQMVLDISCLDRNVDVRLALCTKTLLKALTDEEKQLISNLIDSAVLDSNVKGGLRWPLGKANPGGQFSIIGVWHTKSEMFSNSAMRLKVREADRFDFLTSTGEVTREIVLKLNGVTRNLVEKTDAGVVFTALEDNLKLIWDNFLAWESPIVSFCE